MQILNPLHNAINCQNKTIEVVKFVMFPALKDGVSAMRTLQFNNTLFF